MRRTRIVALRAGLCLAAALSGLAAAYVLREWGHLLWRDTSDEKLDAHAESPISDTEHASVHIPDSDTPPSQTKSLPPIRTHSLPPPIPNAHALLSGPFVSINPDSTTPQTMFTSSDDQEVDEEGAVQTDTSRDSLVDVLSPHPPRVISKRRSMRTHDLFAESHISFSELGSLVASQNGSE